MYVYIQSLDNDQWPPKYAWLVGFYHPKGDWVFESKHGTAEEAAKRVHWLNGGNDDNRTD